MRRTILIVALCAMAAAANAQQADPISATYGQLLAEANDRVVKLSAEAQREKAQIDDLQKQLAAEKAKNAPKPDAATTPPPSP